MNVFSVIASFMLLCAGAGFVLFRCVSGSPRVYLLIALNGIFLCGIFALYARYL